MTASGMLVHGAPHVAGIGAGLSLRAKLRKLYELHRAGPPEMAEIPLAPEVAWPETVEGIAASPTVDQARTLIRPFAFGYDLKPVPLLFRHDPSRVVGQIEELSYDGRGALIIRAVVTDPIARRCCGFSVGMRVHAYSIRHPDTVGFWIDVHRASLDEVSLTPCPANASCIVTERHRTPAHALAHMAVAERLQQAVVTIQKLQKAYATQGVHAP